MSYAPIAIHAIITLLAFVGLAVKLEHRLTEIETDIKWIKQRLDKHCKSDVTCNQTEP